MTRKALDDEKVLLTYKELKKQGPPGPSPKGVRGYKPPQQTGLRTAQAFKPPQQGGTGMQRKPATMAKQEMQPPQKDPKAVAEMREALKRVGGTPTAKSDEVLKAYQIEKQGASPYPGAVWNPTTHRWHHPQTGKRVLPTREVGVSTRSYEASHMKHPGRVRTDGPAHWGFEIGGEQKFIHGTYAEALKEAKKHAAERGHGEVKVLP